MSKRKQFISENGVNYANHERVAIGGEIFEIVGFIDCEKFNVKVNKCQGLPTLLECYRAVSSEKEEVYCKLVEMAQRYRIEGLYGAHGISSFNTFMFTFDCIITNGLDNFYAHITPAHNYLYVFGKEV
jgi:hypothetical protein